MDAHSLQSLRECKGELLEVIEISSRDLETDHYRMLIKNATNEAKLIITTASQYLLQLKQELKEFKDILRRVNIKMAEQIIKITSKGLFTDGEKLSDNEKDDLNSLKSDEFRFEYGETQFLHDRQVQIKLNLDIKKSIHQTKTILDEVDDDIMVNTVAVEELEDFIQKWAEKLIEEEETSKEAEEEKEEVNKEDADKEVKDNTELQTEVEVKEEGNDLCFVDDSTTLDETGKMKDQDGKDNDDDDFDEETLKQEIDAISNDDKRLPSRSKTLLSMKTDMLGVIPETDVDDSDEENRDEDNTVDKLKNDKGSSNDNEEKKEDLGVDKPDEETNDDDDDGDDNLERLMLDELQEQVSEQEREDPFPAAEWDTFTYYRDNIESGNNGKEIICVVIVKREMLRQNDVICSGSQNINDLKSCLKNKYEKLLSYFVTVKFLRETVDAGECYVFVPYQPPYKKLEHVVRTRSHEGQWTDLPPEHVITLPAVPGVTFSGVVIQEKNSSVGLIVVLKESTIRYHIPDDGLAIEPASNRNMTILVSPATFSCETSLSFSNDDISSERLDAYKKENPEFKSVVNIGASFRVVSDETTTDDLSVVFYDLLKAESNDPRSPEKEALWRCWRQLVNGLDVNKLLDTMVKKGNKAKTLFKGQSLNDFRQKVEMEELAGDKARLLLREVEQGSSEDIRGFVACLRESGHAPLASLFTDTVDKITKKAKTSSSSTRRGNLEVKTLIRRDDGPWIPNSPVTISEHPDDFLVVLPPGGREYHVIVVNLSAQMMKRDLLTFGDVIVNDASGIRTSLICRQHSTHPEKIVLQCVRSEIAASRIRYLKDNGYTLGLEEDIQFRMCDGENLEITFDLNLGLVDIGEDGILRLCYFSHLDTAHFVGDLFLVDERAQSQEPVFSGDLYFNVGSVKQRPPRTGCIKITLPKSVVPYIDRTPFRMLDVQVVAVAKFIGFRLGTRGRDSVLQFASSLVDDEDLRRRLYVKVRRVCRGKDDRARCEMFIINWARQRLKFENKVILLLDALWFEPDIQADAKDFAMVYSNSGILCDHYLQKMSEFIGEEWQALGRSLCVPERDLRLLRIDFKDRAVRNFKLLDTFRFSRIAIEQGTSVIRFLLRACKSAGCTGGLITFIRYIAGIFKELTFMRPQSWMSMSSAMPSVEIT
ncbi:uncharacterized protein LOC111133637 isoform X1 [Crassostrea virginica]